MRYIITLTLLYFTNDHLINNCLRTIYYKCKKALLLRNTVDLAQRVLRMGVALDIFT